MSKTQEEKLIERIQSAFSNVKLEDGVSLNMTKYNDSGGSSQEYLTEAIVDERNDWQAISDETLEQFNVTFSFTDVKGFRFYLPAYMIWTIKNHAISDNIIADFTIYALKPDHHVFKQAKVDFYDWFTAEQLDSIIAFLKFCTKNYETLDSLVARENLEEILNGK